jgi:hypothetical protein
MVLFQGISCLQLISRACQYEDLGSATCCIFQLNLLVVQYYGNIPMRTKTYLGNFVWFILFVYRNHHGLVAIPKPNDKWCSNTDLTLWWYQELWWSDSYSGIIRSQIYHSLVLYLLIKALDHVWAFGTLFGLLRGLGFLGLFRYSGNERADGHSLKQVS